MLQRTVVIAPDSFKGSLSASDAATAMAAGVRDALGDSVDIVLRPLADGGEGTLQVFLDTHTVEGHHVDVHDALGRPRSARYGMSSDCRMAIIEAAEANGLPHVADRAHESLRADSFGVGEIVRDALERGVTEILLCIGGSATTDGGTGLLRALGVRFLDRLGDEVSTGGGGLDRLVSIDLSKLHPRARTTRWRVANDVDNTLCGPNGAARVFGPQKGASPGDVEALDRGLYQLARVLFDTTGIDVLHLRGGGAAGGIPVALHALLDAELVPGFDVVAAEVNLAESLDGASLVLTGEGALDAQSLEGKVVDGVVRYSREGCPIIVIAGEVRLSPTAVRAAGITAAFSLAKGPAELHQMRSHAADLLMSATSHVTALADSQLPTGSSAIVGPRGSIATGQ